MIADDEGPSIAPVTVGTEASRSFAGARRVVPVPRVGRRLGRVAPPLAILAAYAASLLVLPPNLPVPLIDDWNYLLSVRRLVEHGEIWVAPWTAATLLLQIGWGALFAWPLGVSPETLRVSTLVASCGGTLACFALFRELRVSRGRALVGALAVWFNPLVFSLSYTFMTDVPFLALLSGAAFATFRGERRASLVWLAIGSALAGLAFLVRQQGMLLPLAVIAWLLVARPTWFKARPWSTGIIVVGPCLVAVGLYTLWAWQAGLPRTQVNYVETFRAVGFWGTLDLTWRLAIVGAFYGGLFVLPLVVGSIGNLAGAWRRARWPVRHLTVVWLASAFVWTRWYAATHDGLTFPFVPWGSILGYDGLGVLDADGERTMVFARWHYAAFAALLALSAAAAFVQIAGRQRTTEGAGATEPALTPFLRTPGGLLAFFAAAQLAGMVLPSLLIRRMITFDRYYLPLLPFTLGLLLWSVRGQRFAFPAPVVVLIVLAVVSIVGCQDWFAFKRAQWETSTWLVEARGVPLRQVDGAAQWDGLHWYEESLAHPNDRLPHRPDDPWWLHLIAPMIDPVYIVAASAETRGGYEVWTRRPFHSWLRPKDESWIYVWRRLPERASDEEGRGLGAAGRDKRSQTARSTPPHGPGGDAGEAELDADSP